MRSAAWEASLDRKRNDAPLVRAHGELAAERRECALVAIGSFADAATDADGHGCAIEAEPFRVNDLVGMGNFTADADRVLAVGAQEIARALDDAAPHAQVANTVRHLRDLHQDVAWMTEGFVHVPQRARPPETGELEACRAVPLGDVAGLVHAHEIERHAARAGTLQRAQAMRHLLEARVVAVLQLLDVVTQFHGGRRKAPIRHDERTGRVIEQTDAGDVARGRRLEPGGCQHLVAEVGNEQIGQLRRKLKCARRLRQVAVERQHLRCRIVMTDQAGIRLGPHDPDAEPLRERPLERGYRIAVAVDADVSGECFGRDVQFVDVVIAVVEKVAHLLVRHQRVGRVLGSHLHRLVEAQDPFVERAVGPVQGEVLTSQRRRRRGRQLEFGQRG